MIANKHSNEAADLYLEMSDLISYDSDTGIIRVDKSVFDSFVPNTYINIQFIDSPTEGLYQFIMVSETDTYIEMEMLV